MAAVRIVSTRSTAGLAFAGGRRQAGRVAGASEADLDAVESALGVRLPAALRELLGQTDGFEGWYGDVYLAVYGTDALVAVNLEIERHPGFLAFGSDGSRELIGLDLRRSPSPVVMIDITSSGWGEARFQAATLAAFMEQRAQGAALFWDVVYEPDS